MRITSAERGTGMGARHETQVLCEDGTWVAVSQFPEATHLGRRDGFELYELELPSLEPKLVRAYHRSNSGAVETHEERMCAGFQGQDIPCQ